MLSNYYNDENFQKIILSSKNMYIKNTRNEGFYDIISEEPEVDILHFEKVDEYILLGTESK